MWSDGIFYPVYFVVVVQQPSRVQLFTTAARQASLSLTISQSLPKFMFIALVMPSRHLIIWCPLLFLHSIFPSIGTFPTSRLFASDDQNTGASTSASILPVNIQVWSPLRLVWSPCCPGNFQESSPALKFKDIKILWRSAFFMVQLAQSYVTTGKTLALIYGPLSAEYCLCFSTHCLDLSSLSCQKQ